MAPLDTPSRVVEAAFEALGRRDWRALEPLVEGAALNVLRQHSLGMIILTTEERLAGTEGDGGYNPDQVVIADHLPTVGTERVPLFPDAPTVAQLASLDVRAFFVQWCAAAFDRIEDDDPMGSFLDLKREVIGEVREGGDLAHVLYRLESRHIWMHELFIDLPGRVMIMPLKLVGGEWKLLLNDDLGHHVAFMYSTPSTPRIPFPPLKRTTRTWPQIPPPSGAPPVPSEGPETIVQAAFKAFEGGNWEALAALVDAERLEEFQRSELAHLAAWQLSREARAKAESEGIKAFMLSYDDTLSPGDAVAPVRDVRVSVFADEPTFGELAQLSAPAFFKRWCQSVYQRPESGGFGPTRTQWKRHIVGEVFEHSSLAHVVYRSEILYARPWPIGRMPLKLSTAGWRLLLNDDIGWTVDLSILLDRP